MNKIEEKFNTNNLGPKIVLPNLILATRTKAKTSGPKDFSAKIQIGEYYYEE